ncbi:MAG: molecular chaperone HtpG, partial [Bacteroidales bacterium]|nr:molecular chaperone HtpG [Bacteroidales bacterium]
YLQSDANVKKISGHITKKVAERLQNIFKDNREEFEQKWDNLKLFIEYGMLTDEKFYEKACKFALLKNTDDKYFTYDEYKELIKANQTDKDNSLIYLYATDKLAQYTYIEKAKKKGYDVLLFDGQLDIHMTNFLESKFESSKFVRVDSDVIEKIIRKDEPKESNLSEREKSDMRSVFSYKPESGDFFNIVFEVLDDESVPAVITQSEYMRRMKDMSSLGGGMNYYGELPNSYNIVINPNHPIVTKIHSDLIATKGDILAENDAERKDVKAKIDFMEAEQKGKKPEEIPQDDKDDLENLRKNLNEINEKRAAILEEFGSNNKSVKQLIDLALLANNMLKGEALDQFVKRSVELL